MMEYIYIQKKITDSNKHKTFSYRFYNFLWKIVLSFKHSYENINTTINIALDTGEILAEIELSSLERNHPQMFLSMCPNLTIKNEKTRRPTNWEW